MKSRSVLEIDWDVVDCLLDRLRREIASQETVEKLALAIGFLRSEPAFSICTACDGSGRIDGRRCRCCVGLGDHVLGTPVCVEE